MMTGRRILQWMIDFARTFRKDDGAAAAIQFALMAVPLTVTVFGMIDVSRASAAKGHLQDALDAAALAAARSTATTDAGVQAIGEDVLAVDLVGARATLKSSSFTIVDNTIVATATAATTPYIAGLWHDGDLEMSASTEVVRASKNIEVALALDVTGSMGGSKIADLRTAAKELVDIVVQTQQSPYYTRVALAPYSMGVNVGGYAASVRGAVTSGTCTTPGCNKFTFTTAAGGSRTNTISNCVSERTGGEAYTDTAPSTAPVGRNYPNSGNPCLGATIVPLSSDKASLKASIDTYTASGSTAGHIGLAWSWYLVSPNWGYLWPAETNRPAAYGAKDLLKVVVLMTDGEFNTTYCNGVISRDAASGSGSSSTHINCNAPNGDAFVQAEALCDAMKAKGVVIYTVGFDLGGNAAAENIMEECATSAEHVYLPDSGTDLKKAFKEIGQDINALRLSR
ncbi:MAG TPA: pilus assembly protein TadG-related protein [Caulobacter sp.]|nr:pilus assembly protein TadG-related protein [Caulobacter sp.]